jgi:hypothetical protein
MSDHENKLAKNYTLYCTHEAGFLTIFGRPLQDYWHARDGLNLLKLDQDLIKSNYESMEATIQRRYGCGALHLVRQLCGIELGSLVDVTV